MRLYRQILIPACCVAPLALATGASAACLDEVEKLSAQVQSHQTPPKGPPATRTANDPEPPAHAKGDTAEKARGNQDQGAASGKSGADPRASASGGAEESQTGVTTGPGVVMGDAGPADAGMLLADARAKQAKGDEAGCMAIVEKVKETLPPK
ncbi:hypothetical protein [Hansschlegelia beijingensis]|uniref:Uncharacterized protein n=1 Tax=Hansschlegelia beijingensis TaxID=1133344 RepID=A0A7W6D0N0_9HYPH|nr:hypothetical protein [Hansschlegelia beijingensis]MBB3973704.1 hypothetical protein [Hansschlegelia beijingensis]